MNDTKLKTLTVYIGCDSNDLSVADVCRYSIQQNSSIPVNVVYLKKVQLQQQDIYKRIDSDSDRDSAFTRFLVPYLNDYTGWAIYVDCNFIFVDDIANLIRSVDRNKAVMVADIPWENRSSLIVWNCEHASNRCVDLGFVNTESGSNLQGFQWLDEKEIGKLSPEWNWLVGWHREYRDGHPRAIHYFSGGPWVDSQRDCEYATVWHRYSQGLIQSKTYVSSRISDLTLPAQTKELFDRLDKVMRDPFQRVYNISMDDVAREIDELRKIKVVGMMDTGEDEELPKGINMENKDVILENFIIGSQGILATWHDRDKFPKDAPFVIRGIAKRKIIHQCIDQKRDFFYIDTGYFGNAKHKTYHRITKNNLQYLGRLDDNCPDDRFVKTGVALHKYRGGRNILICPPSQKAMNYWGLDLQKWLEETVATIQQHTDRPIVIREKQGRSARVAVDTMEMALSRDVHCLVTFNSIAAVEALIFGKPVFTMGPNAAQPLANTDLSHIDRPSMPTLDEVRNLCCNLAYQQFSNSEMVDGTAWKMLNGL